MQIEATGAVGAEVTGVDLGSLSAEEFEQLQQAYADHSVLFIRDQNLEPNEHVAFAERWGDININRFFQPVDGHPNIALVAKEPEQTSNIGGGWHTDHSYDQIPALGSLLYAKEVPPVGGDTLFASTCAAYDSLSDGLKETLGGLNACHSSRHAFGKESVRAEQTKELFNNPELATQDAVHPVIVTHPLSGRKSLYVNPGFTLSFEGWTAEESQPLLEYLYRHVGMPQHSYRLQWRKGTLAFWDNRATWHWAVNDYHGHRRLMHRITVEGVALGA
ncbi:MAG: taurine dioxygenase [Limisphaerales bacterium]|jgi:taurine dioxygenase